MAEIAFLIASARVVVFRGQQADDAQFVRFLRGLGRLTFTRGETPVEGAPDLNIVTNLGRSTPPRSVFHTDSSYMASPPSFTALRPAQLPNAGGQTLFSDQVRVASELTPAVRRWLAGRRVLHRSTGIDRETESHWHPLFRRHPLTGETALFLSTPQRCVELSGADRATAQRVIGALYRRSTRPSRLYRHRWQAGDILVWDNRVTMHRADHADVSGARVLHRGMVAGEVPQAATE